MWNKVSSNKHLQKLSKQQAYRKHITTLYKMKPTISTKPPAQPISLKHNPKAQQKRRQREDEIEKTNNILVEKMLENGPMVRAKSQVYFKDSLNSNIVKQKERQIDAQNQRLVKKIKAVHSQYSKNKMQKQAEKYDRLKNSMAYSRMQETYDLLENNEGKSRRRPKTANHQRLNSWKA